MATAQQPSLPPLAIHQRIPPWPATGSLKVYGRILSMTRGGRRPWPLLGLSLVVALTAGCVALVFHLRDQNEDSFNALFGTLLAVATAAVGAATWLWRRARPTKARLLPLEQAADELAEQLGRQWKQAAVEQGLTSAPIPVRWQWSYRQVTGPIANAVGGLGGGRFAPLPKMAAVTEEQLCSGTLHDLLDVYGGLNSGRLVVLGELGAGKSGAGILLLLDTLAHRATVKAEDRARVPVPVLVSPHGWDPINESFSEWLANRLKREYALLRAPEYGRDAVVQLIQSGHFSVILDGLDEMPDALRAVALRAMDRQATFRLIVLTRSEELVAAVSGGHLRGAAALELLPINSEQAAEYLTSCQIHPLPRPWQHLIEYLQGHPDGVLAQALSTPLMLTLVRDTYGSGEKVHEPIAPDELIDVNICRFDSRGAVEDYLLDRLLTAAYGRDPGKSAPPYTVDQARRWLGQLAHRMKKDGARDLAWWRIPRWVPAWPRALVTVVVMGVVSVFLVGPLAGLAAHMNLLSAFQVGPLAAFGAFCGKALGFGFMFGLGLLLVSPPGEESPPQRNSLRWSRTDIIRIFFLAVGVGGGVGLERGLVGGLEYGLAGMLMSSFVVGLGFVLGGGPPQQLGWLQWSKTDTRMNLLTGILVGLAAGLVTGVGYGLVYGPKYGLAPGFIVGIAYMCVIVLGGQSSSRWSQFLWSRTDISTTVLIGLAIAIVSAAGYGVIYVLIVILGGRSPLQRSRPRWSRTATPATLLTGLIAGLVFGLVFGLTHGLGFVFKPGIVIGLVFGLTIGLLLGLRQPSTEAASPLGPQRLWRRERQFGLGFGLGLGLVVGLTAGLADGLVFGPGAGLVFGLTSGLVAGLGSGLMSSATWATVLASAQLWGRGEAPVRLLRFLDDARERQILRTVGPMYQFRNARLQDRLAEACESVPGKERRPCETRI